MLWYHMWYVLHNDEVHSFSLLGINREVSFYPDIKKAE